MAKGNKGNPYEGNGISQDECAKRLGITRERVSQIERQAIAKLVLLVNPDWRPEYAE